MKIIKLSANNIKKLKAVEITPKGDVVIISGKNGQGKTNVLEAIWYALAGSKGIPTEPVRQGEEEGDIELDLGEYIVSRKFTKGGENTYLEVRNKDGAKFPSPQALLDKLIGDISFNPIDLMRSNNRDQMLLEIAGLSSKLQEFDFEKENLYQERTFQNRETKKFEAQIKKNLKKVEQVNFLQLVETERRLLEHEDVISSLNAKILSEEKEIQILSQRIEEAKNGIKDMDKEKKRLLKDKENFPSLESIREQIGKAEETNRQAREYEENLQIQKSYTISKDKAQLFTDKIDSIDKEKKELIANAKFPVPEMGYRDGKVTYKDIPLDQLSKSEEVLLGIQIQMKLLPNLKVILIPDASLLDNDSMAILEKLAKDRDYQLWVERVEDEKVGVLIEDGTVKADYQ